MRSPTISVIMPSFEQATFLPKAIRSLQKQKLTEWELIIVDDGSTDRTPCVVEEFLDDARIRYERRGENGGLGAALNAGLSLAAGDLIAYLPSDDVFYPDHLASLSSSFRDPWIVMAIAQIDGSVELRARAARHGPQLVQVMHRRTATRWLERSDLETDDLDRLFWRKLRAGGDVAHTGSTTCAWEQHAGQRHRAILESLDGGLNVFRRRYRVRQPLRFHSTDSWLIDEPALYAGLGGLPAPRDEGLKILIVGELSYNPERILALRDRGHSVHALWSDDILGPMTVGPLPFAGVDEVSRSDWKEEVNAMQPDVVYGLLSWRAVPLAHEVLASEIDAAFVWHFKEAPQRCMERGTWRQLADLHLHADRAIYASPLEKEWMESAVGRSSTEAGVLDGDLPSARWFAGDVRSPIREEKEELHTVVLGRPLGMDLALLEAVCGSGIHVHFYGLMNDRGPGGRWKAWLPEARARCGRYVHVHPHMDQRDWATELARYDAGWLHVFTSRNEGDLSRATWDDLNLPGRMSVLLAAGVPVIQRASPGSRVATQELVRELGVGILFETPDDLAASLGDRALMADLHARASDHRRRFTFDDHVDELSATFTEVVRC